ncbi:MAG TPA: Do family serine endopeptidase [bacterium]|nr:Do family serine endopeptidase [bacterium]
MKIQKNTWMSVTGFVLIGVAVGIIFASNMRWVTLGNAARSESPVLLESQREPSETLLRLQNTSQAFVEITKEVLPSVVAIYSTKEISRPSRQGSPFPPFFEEWFGRRFQEPTVPQRQTGLGSGVIVSRDGYILTNNHVVEDADEIRVELHDNRHFDAKIVATDPLTDVAVVKIEGQDLPTARLGNSDDIQIGEWVLAMGNPLRLNSTVTAGIVSALNRNIDILRGSTDSGNYEIENFIQTDAAINRGNSGGALVNLRGEVVGINTAIASGSGFFAGYGFAIPINLARKVMDDLITKGYVTRAYLGIGMLPVDENIAQRYGMEHVRGAIVDQIMPESPAGNAGLRRLDILIAVDGKEIVQPSDVQGLIALMTPGDKVTLTILRDGKRREVEVKLGQRDTGKEAPPARDEGDVISKLGLEVENLTDEIRGQLGLDKDAQGVVVTRVEPFGAASDARISRGDLITAIEDVKVRNVSEYRSAIRKFEKGKVVIFHLKRRDTETAAFVKLPR